MQQNQENQEENHHFNSIKVRLELKGFRPQYNE